MSQPLDKLRTGVNLAFDGSQTIDEVATKIDILKNQGLIPTAGEVDGFVESLVEKQNGNHKSKLDVRTSNYELASLSSMFFKTLVDKNGEQTFDWEDPYLDYHLSTIWKDEPILSGAVYSMSAKMSALEWMIIGGRTVSKKYARMFSSAAHMGGYSWDGFISATCQDFYTTNRGIFWETPRNGNPIYGKLADLGHVDALSCTLTGNSKRPVWYVSELTGQVVKFKPGEFIHFASMPSARERMLGSGFCAVARALKAARLLIGMRNYDIEKLNNLPPEGVAAVSGMTYEELMDAFTLWQTERKKNDSLTFPQVLWLLSSVPGAEVKVDIQSFSQLPESFDRDKVITQYVNLIALVFGVDAREFWPISTSSMGTASESEIQHLKAKGKGHGEFISMVERHINGELEEGVDFEFDTQDIDEDLKAATVAKAWIDAYLPLLGQGAGGKQPAPTAPAAGMPGQNPQGGSAPANDVEIITKDELKRLLADKGVLPDYMVSDDRIAIRDHDVHMKDLDDDYDEYPDDIACYRWKNGVVKRERTPGINLWTLNPPNVTPKAWTNPLPTEMVEKGGSGSGNFGHSGRKGMIGGSGDSFANEFNVFQFPKGSKKFTQLQRVPSERDKSASSSSCYSCALSHADEQDVYVGMAFDKEDQQKLKQGIISGVPHAWNVNADGKVEDHEFGYIQSGIYIGVKVDPTITNASDMFDIAEQILYDAHYKEEPVRNIRGNPIPDREATRGAGVTKKTIRDETEKWKSNPELAKYALEESEIDVMKLPEAKMKLKG